MSLVSRWCLWAALYVLSSPWLLLKLLVELHRTRGQARRGTADTLTCPTCHFENPLKRFAICNRCGDQAFGLLTFCARCEQVTPFITCRRCRRTLKVF